MTQDYTYQMPGLLRPEGRCPVCMGMNLKGGRVTVRPEDRDWMYAIRDMHKGKRAFVLGAGPSLNLEPPELVDLLGKEVTFACNFLSKWPGLTFQPTYWCASEEDWIARIEDSLLDWEQDRGFAGTVRVFAKNRFPATLGTEPLRHWARVHVEGSMFVKDGFLGGVNEYPMEGNPHFAYSGTSVVVDCAVQLALWVGCDRVYLAGVDAKDPLRHAYDGGDGREGTMSGDRVTGEGGGKWQVLVEAVGQVEELAKKGGRRVINTSRDSALTVPRVTLGEALRG